MNYQNTPQSKRRIEMKLRLWEYKLTHPCVDCGEVDPIVLTFDHKSKKKDAIANYVHTMAHRKFAWEKILLEIKKCEVRCFNCHMRRTAKQLNCYKWLLEPTKN